MILFENAGILTNSQSGYIDSGYVLVDGARIAAVGAGACTRPEAEAARRVNVNGQILMPGLANAHCHIPMVLLRNYADDMDLQNWLFNRIFPIEDRMGAADIDAGTRLGLLEMVAGGTTAFLDMYYFCDETARAVEEAGIRCVLTRGLMNPQGDEGLESDSRIAEALRFAKDWHGAADGRILAGLGPHSVYTCTPAYLRRVADIAVETGMLVHVHLDETKREHDECLARHGVTPTRHLLDCGLFRTPTVAAHCVHVSADDLRILAENGVSIAHNPTSNLKLASGIAPVPAAQAAGIRVALGTDGASSNNNLDMWEEVNLAALLHKGVSLDPLAVPAAAALEMGTASGAEAMGFADCGRLEAGKRADLVMIDPERVHSLPRHNPVSAMAYSMRSSDVRMTMVDGRELYRDGEFLTLDRERILASVKASCARLFV